MFRAWAELIQHFVMQLCTVALVPCKLILRVLLIQHVDDIAVTADLGQDGGGGDGGGVRVTAHDTAVGRGDGSELTVVTVAVDEGKVRPRCQTIDGQLHGLHAGGEDIRLVDLPSGDGGHGPGQGLLPSVDCIVALKLK